MRAERAVGWPALAPALICLVKRVVVSSQRVGAPSGWGTGRTRRCCQRSGGARRTAVSVTSLPSCVARSYAERPESFACSARRVEVFSARGETFVARVVVGGGFQGLAPGGGSV